MTLRSLVAALVCVAFANRSVAADSDRYVKLIPLPTGQVAVVAEGDMEARSIGSYSVRIYSNADSKYPTDDYICGLVQPRDGSVEDVKFADVNQDKSKELILTIRCVGTGQYLSADAFSFNGKRLTRVGAVSGLPNDADCVAALEKAILKKQDIIPPSIREQLDKTYPGWHPHQVDTGALNFFKNNCPGNPAFARGDFNGDGLEDVGLLIDHGKQRLLIIAHRTPSTENYGILHFDQDGADYILVSRKGKGGFDHNTGKGFIFPTDSVEVNWFEKAAKAYVYKDGRYVVAQTSD